MSSCYIWPRSEQHTKKTRISKQSVRWQNEPAAETCVSAWTTPLPPPGCPVNKAPSLYTWVDAPWISGGKWKSHLYTHLICMHNLIRIRILTPPYRWENGVSFIRSHSLKVTGSVAEPGLEPWWARSVCPAFPFHNIPHPPARNVSGNLNRLNSYLHVYIFQHPLGHNEPKRWGSSQGETRDSWAFDIIIQQK